MVRPKVTVLGAGPSGLVAAHAARQAGYDVMVLSKKRKSHLWGCQYLHAEIPGLPHLRTPAVEVHYQLEGTAEGYLAKVYGEDYDGTVSPQEMTEYHAAYDLRETYTRLWDRWEKDIVDAELVNPRVAHDVIPDFTREGIVFNTIPRHALCVERGHLFASQEVWAMGDSDEQVVPVRPPADNTVVCNGDPDTSWYRTSKVFGHVTCEWPWRDGKRPPFRGVVPLVKPLHTNCTCLPEVHYVGRYGKWQKGYLVHQVYQEVTAVLEAVGERLF